MPQLGSHPTPLKTISGASGPVHHFTCRHEEDAGTKDDVVSGFVELAGCNAESTHEKQNHTQDRENTRGSNSPCGGERERGRKNSAGVKERKKGHGNSGGARGHEHVLCVEAKGRDRGQRAGKGLIQRGIKVLGDGGRERETKCVRKRERSKAAVSFPGHCHKTGGLVQGVGEGRGPVSELGACPCCLFPLMLFFPPLLGGLQAGRGGSAPSSFSSCGVPPLKPALQRAATQMLPAELLNLESSRKGTSVSRRIFFF